MQEIVGVLVKALLQVLLVVGVITLVIAIHSCVSQPETPLPASAAAAAAAGTVPTLNGPPVLAIGLSSAGGTQAPAIAVNGPYRLLVDRGATPARAGATLPPTRVSSSPNGIFVGAEELSAREIDLVPERDGTLRVNNRLYHGSVRLVRSDATHLAVVNLIDLESYLAGVLGGEMKLDWPDAALRAQAVAARTYALWELKRMRATAASTGVDLYDDTSAQSYLGMERENDKARRIVQETRGQILVFAGALVPALYHSNCGGGTEPGYLYFVVPNIAPLAGRTCGYCANTSFSAWRATYTKREIGDILFPRGGKKNVTRVRVAEAAPGGHAARIGIMTAGSSHELLYNANDFRRALGNDRLRSTHFALRDLGSSYEFTGQGWGHGVGLCQYGARGMSMQGFSGPEILQYYYPGAELVRIY